MLDLPCATIKRETCTIYRHVHSETLKLKLNAEIGWKLLTNQITNICIICHMSSKPVLSVRALNFQTVHKRRNKFQRELHECKVSKASIDVLEYLQQLDWLKPTAVRQVWRASWACNQVQLHIRYIYRDRLTHTKIYYTPQNKHGAWKWNLEQGDSYWKPSFAGSMLNFGGVIIIHYYI